jgi:hypothetical protein
LAWAALASFSIIGHQADIQITHPVVRMSTLSLMFDRGERFKIEYIGKLYLDNPDRGGSFK